MTSESSGSPRPRLLVLAASVDGHESERSLLPVLEQLTRDHAITVVTPDDGPLLASAEKLGCDCHVIGGRARSAPRFLRTLHAQAPFVGVFADATAKGLLPYVRRAVRVPLVVHLRELPPDPPVATRLRWRLASRVADSVVCDTVATARATIESYPRLADRVRISGEQAGAAVATQVRAAIGARPAIVVLSPSSDLYGSDRALLHALPALGADRPVVVAVAADGPFVDEARRAGAAVVALPDFAARRRYLRPLALPGLLVRNIRAAGRIRSLMKKRDGGLLYVNTVAVPMLPVLPLITRRPILVHVHERARGGAWEQILITAGVKRGADLVVANSAFTAATLGLDRGRRRVEVVHNGVDPALPAAPDCAGPIRLVCVARLHPKKGQWILIDAVARLVDQGHDLAVDLVGDALPEHAELERELRAQVDRLDLADRVIFHGYRADVDAVYHRGHVVVVPSVDPEEFSLVAAEGQIRGLPAVVTGPGGVSEVVSDGETGLVVAPDDVDELTGAIARLASDPDLRTRLGTAGRERMMERFTVDHYRARIAAVVAALVTDG